MPPTVPQRGNDTCPFLVPVLADHLFVYPTRAFCRRPGARLRIPAETTLERVCTRSHRTCPGYQASTEGANDQRAAMLSRSGTDRVS